MKMKRCLKAGGASIAAIIAACATTVAYATDITVANGPANDAVDYFGFVGVPTIGEVIDAPITGELTSFTLSLNGPVGDLFGAVGTWSSVTDGSPTLLYQSGYTSSAVAAAYTFSPDVAVVAGHQYIVYISDYDAPIVGYTTVPSVISNIPPYPSMSPYLEGYDSDDGDGNNNPSWTQGAPSPEDSLLVSVTFAPSVVSGAPEPSAWALMIAGVAMVGGMMRARGRRQGFATA